LKNQERVTFGELVRMVQRIETLLEKIDGATDSIEKRVTLLEVIHPHSLHALSTGSGGTFAKFLAAMGTIVFSVTAAIVSAIATWRGGHQ
jgi:hypothetical protein